MARGRPGAGGRVSLGPGTAPNSARDRGGLIEFPAPPSSAELALEELELVYAFIHARVGNRPDAEDLTQQVAMKAIPRLHEGVGVAAVRAYLFRTARTVLATFWAARFGMPEEELADDVASPPPAPEPNLGAAERAARILGALPENYRRVLELRFLRGYSIKEVAKEIGVTVGNAKVIQYRALRRAAALEEAGDA